MKKDKENKFLSLSGLQTLLKALNEKFSKKEHKHSRSDITDLVIASKEKAGIVRPSGNYLTVSPTGDLNVTIPTAANNIAGIVRIGDNINLTNDVISVPVATSSKTGLVRVGDNITVKNGLISVETATKERYGVVSIGEGLNVNEKGIVSVKEEVLTIIDRNWSELYKNLLLIVGELEKKKKYNVYVTLINTDGKVDIDNIHTILMSQDIINIIRNDTLKNFVSEIFSKYCKKNKISETKGAENLYPFGYDDENELAQLFIHYEIIKLLSTDRFDIFGFTSFSETDILELKNTTGRIMESTVEVIEYKFNPKRLEIFFEEKYPLIVEKYFKDEKQIVPMVFKLHYNKNNGEYTYKMEDDISPKDTHYERITDTCWLNVFNKFKQKVYDVNESGFYGSYLRLENTDDNSLFDKEFNIQITPEVVDIVKQSDAFIETVEKELTAFQDNELEILYPQKEFNLKIIIKELPPYMLIRLLSLENMDLVCLKYINELLKSKEMEEIRKRTNRTLTKKVELTECSINAEDRMALLFEQPTDNSDSDYYNLDEYYRNGKQIMPIVFELRHTTDANGNNVYRYEIVQ